MCTDAPPPDVRFALGSYEALRRSRFTPDEIYFSIAAAVVEAVEPEKYLHLFVEVHPGGRRGSGDAAFTIDCGRTALRGAPAVQCWMAWWNDAAEADRARIFEEWRAGGHTVPFVQALLERGLLRGTTGAGL